MAWTTPPTFVAGDALTASEMNAYVTANTNFLYSRPSAQAYTTTNYSHAGTGTYWEALDGLDLENWDTDSFHSTSTNTDRMTIPSGLGGRYRFDIIAEWTANTTGQRGIRLNINGGSAYRTLYLVDATSSANHRASASFQLSLSAGDYVSLELYQNSGGSLNINPVFFGCTWEGN